MKDVIILVPGITGSVLQKGGEDIWAPSNKAFFLGLFSDTTKHLELNDDGQSDIVDGISPTRLVPDAVIFAWQKIGGYTVIEEFLKSTFELFTTTEGNGSANFCPFPYDWRRDNR